MWKLEDLLNNAKSNQTYINSKWIPARPENFKITTMNLVERIRDSWEVFKCRAEAFK